MRMWRHGAALMLVLSGFVSSARAETGPPLSVSAGAMAAALDCPTSLTGAARAPVLLIPGTNTEPKTDFDWNYEPALTAAGIPWCAVTLPRDALGDSQVAAEYVVFALRQMHARAGRRVSIVGWSQGGMVGRWALKWWPDTRDMVEDLVGLAPSNHGTTSARTVCTLGCSPAYWQQRNDSKFIAALNAGPETWAGIAYTVAYTHDDQIVSPNADERTGSSSLRSGAGMIRNVALQDLCPNHRADHFMTGTYDPVAAAIALDALAHPGPADPARIDRGVCAQTLMPGVNPITFPVNFARVLAVVGASFAQSEYVGAEPPLKCYVTSTCPLAPSAPGTGQGTAATPRCVNHRHFSARLARGLRRARVTLAGRRQHVLRRHRRLVAMVDLRRRRHGTARLVIRGVTGHGRHIRRIRHIAVCR